MVKKIVLKTRNHYNGMKSTLTGYITVLFLKFLIILLDIKRLLINRDHFKFLSN